MTRVHEHGVVSQPHLLSDGDQGILEYRATTIELAERRPI
jgi:hypothetical protein